MSNINNAIILSFTTLILIVFFINYSEKFTNMLNNSLQGNSLKKDLNGYVTEDISNLEIEEVVDEELKTQVEDLVDQILERFNRDYNKKLIRISIERVEKSVDSDKSNFQVWIFVFNYKKESNAKVLIDFDLDLLDHVKVNKVEVLGSRQSIVTSRGGISARDFDSKREPINMDNVEGLLFKPVEFSNFNVAESSNKMVDRHSWIMLKPRESLGNVKTFPARKVHEEWDVNGVKIVDKMEKGTPGGINHGNRNLSLVPHFMKNNFELCYGDYLWLFDKAEDVESRPIGVG